MTLTDVFEDMKTVAIAAGSLALGAQKDLLMSEKSSPKDIVTNADIEVEAYIKEALAKHGFGYLCEESLDVPSNSSYTWIVDPIDGTSNYYYGHPDWSISIGLREGKNMIAGVVYSPSDKKLYSAIKGQGAYLQDSLLRPASRSLLHDAFFNFAYLDEIKRFAHFAKPLWDASRKSDVMGSMAKSFCYVAEGIYDASFGISSSLWDYAAAAIILEESGAILSTIPKGIVDFTQKKAHVCALSPAIYSTVFAALKHIDLEEVTK